MTASCPWCGVARGPGSECAHCGANYDKAAQLRAEESIVPLHAGAPAAEGASLRPSVGGSTVTRDDLAVERRLRLFVPPTMLLLAVLFHASSLGHFLQRTFLSMMVHESGHAITAWYCGYFAVPFVWRTMIAATRGPGWPLLLVCAHAYGLVRARAAGRSIVVALLLTSAGLLVLGTLACSARTAQMLFTFGGDGGAMVLGVALMATFFARPGSHLVTSWLRWGFVVIGAAAFVDTFATWWVARHDFDAIPFGEIEGVGLSDPSKLVEVYGWTTRQLVGRYVWVGVACLTGFGVAWARGVRAIGVRPHVPSGGPNR